MHPTIDKGEAPVASARGGRWCGGRALGAILLLLPFALSPAQVDTSERVESARAALEKLVETRRIISQEKRDWTLGQQVMNDRIEVVRQEIEAIREKIAEAEKSQGELLETKAKLEEESAALKRAADALRTILAPLEKRTLELLKRLPEPAREKVKAVSQDIPADPEATKVSVGRRYQNVIGTLLLVNKFNNEIHVLPEVRELSDGTSAQVTAVYVGIGQGFYVNPRGDVAGIGLPSAEGWSWQPANHAAKEIAKVVKILENEQPAEFVPVPVNVKNGGM